MADTRAIDLLTSSFDLNERRKFTVKDKNGNDLLDLYFAPITRADRLLVQKTSGEDNLKLSTQMLVHKAQNEDGSPAFMQGDVARLKRELPESLLNELELFLFGINEEGEDIEQVKED
tara:strand:+ start:17656 stop:18009 length:354 start_codon:yes stop_codon:yes gene_type:complete